MKAKVTESIIVMALLGAFLALIPARSANAAWMSVGRFDRVIPLQDFHRCSFRLVLNVDNIQMKGTKGNFYFNLTNQLQFSSADSSFTFQSMNVELRDIGYLYPFGGVSDADYMEWIAHRQNDSEKPFDHTLEVRIGSNQTEVIFSYLFNNAKTGELDVRWPSLNQSAFTLEKECPISKLR